MLLQKHCGNELAAAEYGAMAHPVARALWLLLLVALLLGGQTSHEVGMAHDMEPHSAAMHAMHSMAHGDSTESCVAPSCQAGSTPCCVMGQCLLGVFVAAELSFASGAMPRPVPQPIPLLTGSFGDKPFRPPAAA